MHLSQRLFICFILSFVGLVFQLKGEKPISVIIPSYNNAEWYQKNLDSLFSQKYDNYRVIYIDDCSTDGTFQLVKEYVAQSGQMHRFTLVKNRTNKGALYNLYHAIHSCNDNDIIITYDGDDWFPHDEVFSVIDKAYSKKNIWLTHGSFIGFPSQKIWYSIPIPKEVIKKNAFRSYRSPSHLRTFYAWLFKKVKKEDLLYKGNFYSMTWDLAMMLPMIEMAGERHAFLNEVLYVYNEKNPISDFRTNPTFQQGLEKHVRALRPYKRLKSRNHVPK